MALVVVYKNPTYDHIIDNLYLGDIEAAYDSSCINNINIVVNISNTKYNEFIDKEYHYFDIEDNKNENISQFFEKCVYIINIAKKQNKNVLIHCMNSVSRSPTLVLYYLMTIGMTLKDALKFLKSKRIQYTKPNIGFFRQLVDAEKKIIILNH
jgi:protein-tyrosine phosphatase